MGKCTRLPVGCGAGVPPAVGPGCGTGSLPVCRVLATSDGTPSDKQERSDLPLHRGTGSLPVCRVLATSDGTPSDQQERSDLPA